MCYANWPTYVPHSEGGILNAHSQKDGYAIAIEWTRAYPDIFDYSIAYNIYYSSIKEDVFTEGVKFVCPTGTQTRVIIQELTPGDMYYFAVRAQEYDPAWYDLSTLPDLPNMKVLPEGMLLSDISSSDGYIPVSDIETFPNYGVVQIGAEIIRYTSKDLGNSLLLGLTRGFLGSEARFHTTDGYDGYHTFENNLVLFFKGYEEPNETIFAEMCSFFWENYPRTNADGYKEVTQDLLTTDLGGTDEELGAVSVDAGGTTDGSTTAFPPYDFSGWHRTPPNILLNGDCVDSYFGGERGCADGYLGVGGQTRGNSVSDEANARAEVLLNATGVPVVLVRRRWTGIRCKCFTQNSEHADLRCEICLGVGFVGPYQQFFNPRRSDGRIMVRFGPTEDDIKFDEKGFESTFIPDCWTLVVPAVKDRDFIIRFKSDGTEEFRYEILNVTRNNLFGQELGSQKFRAQRVRKTDPIYQWKAVRDTSTIPTVITTGIGMVAGPGGIAPHTHNIVISGDNTIIVNGNTSVSAGHTHEIVDNVVQPALGHTHSFVF